VEWLREWDLERRLGSRWGLQEGLGACPIPGGLVVLQKPGSYLFPVAGVAVVAVASSGPDFLLDQESLGAKCAGAAARAAET
jgi:hypothetical protein